MKRSVSMVVITSKARRFSVRRYGHLPVVVASLFIICRVVSLLMNTIGNISQASTIRPVDIVIHPSLCEEGPTSNMSTTVLSTATSERRRGDYTYYHHITQIVEGPGLTVTDTELAICKFRQIQYWYHFPHT